MSTSAELSTILSNSLKLKQFALALLDTPEAVDHPDRRTTHPLAVLLFLLDSLVFLRSAGELGSNLRKREKERIGLGIDGGEEADGEDQSGARPNAARDKGSETEDESESWEEWVQYIAELVSRTLSTESYHVALTFAPCRPSVVKYLHPATPQDKTWAPLHIHSSIIPTLSQICQTESYSAHSHSLLLDACSAALQHVSPTSSSTPSDPAALKYLLNLPPTSFPTPLSSSVLSTISTTLMSYRQSRNEPPTLTFRSIVSLVLEHLCGCEEEESAPGIEKIFKMGERTDKDNEEGEGDDVEDPRTGQRRSLLRGRDDSVRDANLSILRRDDKLRWIFGGEIRRCAHGSLKLELSAGRGFSGRPKDTGQGGEEAKGVKVRTPPYAILTLLSDFSFLNSDNFQKRASTSSVPSSTTSTPHASPPQRFHSSPLTNPTSSPTHLLTLSPPQVAAFSSPPRSVGSGSSDATNLRPSSMSSFESLASAISSQFPSSSALSSRPHRRVHSTSSSTPLLNPTRSREQVFTQPPPSSPSPFGNLAPESPSPPPFAPRTKSSSSLSKTAEGIGSSPPRTTKIVSLNRDTLSPNERRELVKKSKKLNKMFGVPLEERAAEEVLVRSTPRSDENDRAGLMRKGSTASSIMTTRERRRYSFPAGGSGESSRRGSGGIMEEGQGGGGAESVGMGRSNSSPLTPTFPIGAIQRISKQRGSLTDDESSYARGSGEKSRAAREERRRKLDKVQRLLGERIPAGLVLSDYPEGSEGKFDGGVGRGNSKLGGIWKGLGFGGRDRKREGTGDSWVDVDEPAEYLERDVEVVPNVGTVGRKDATLVQELARTRKMEQVFGALPPASYYNSTHQRSASSPYDSTRRGPRGSIDSTCTNSTIDSYRHSIASLQYLAETDPSALDDIARVYAQDGRLPSSSSPDPDRTPKISQRRGSASSTSRESIDTYRRAPSDVDEDGPIEITDSDKEVEASYRRRVRGMPIHSRGESVLSTGAASSVGSAFEPGPEIEIEMGFESSKEGETAETVGRPQKSRSRTLTGGSEVTARGAAMGKSSSSEGHRRTVQKAQKLASFFGTSRGEVWTMLLDDLEAAIVDEEDVDEDERREVLDGVSKLRKM
ncbi:hypothetical protein P7C70_g6816, partial [Phenoliferia sp. Uapishka_3]